MTATGSEADSKSKDQYDLEEATSIGGEHSLPPAPPVREINGQRKGLFFGVGFLIVAVILGLSLGLTLPNKGNESSELQQVDASTIDDKDTDIDSVPAPTPQPLDPVQKWLIGQGIADPATLLKEGSYQNEAAFWLLDQSSATTLSVLTATDYEVSVPSEAYDQVVRYALACLYYATNPEEKSWVKKLNFLSDKPVCDWQDRNFLGDVSGVGCDDETGLVNSLKLDYNGLSGEMVSELSLIWSLRVLDLEANKLVGTIPMELAEMPILRSLILDRNGMEGPLPPGLGKNGVFRTLVVSFNGNHTGSIPVSLQQSASTMRHLSLDGNQFTGDINFLTNYPNLTEVYLEDNRFSGSLDANFMDAATGLKILDLSDNRIEGAIPEHLFQLDSLVTLDLHGNAFTSLPEFIPFSQSLGFLALHENGLAGQVPASITNLEVLYHLDLSQNAITGDLPTELPSGLTYLFLAVNNFNSGPIPESYANLRLRELSLKSTERTGSIPSFLATDLQDLVLLDLDDNALTGRIPSFRGNQTTDLYSLLLNRNQLTGSVPSSFETLENLRLFFVDGNSITGSLDESLCSLPQFFNASQGFPVTADCEEVACNCCTICCIDAADGEDCHDNDLVASTNPTWERNYNRPSFVFGDDIVLGPT